MFIMRHLIVLGLLFAAPAAAQKGKKNLGMNPGKVDRRIPYYVLPGCEYMLDAGNACDADSMEIPGGCCPVGFECQQKGNGKRWTCEEAPATYELSSDCPPGARVGAHKACTDDSCCPDGFDCFTDATGKSTCEWTGSPVIPPSGASFNAKVKPAGKKASAGRKLHTIDAVRTELDQPQAGSGGRKLKQLINSCASTTLPVGCSRTGPRAQGPSGRCYDIPLNMSGAPPPVHVNTTTGVWVLRGSNTPVKMRGINWFGFNVGQTMVDGLWGNYMNATVADFPTVLKRIKLLGFNALRLPFTFRDLDMAPKLSLYVSGTKVDSINQFKASLRPTHVTPTTTIPDSAYLARNACPYTTNPTATAQGTLTQANMHLPGKQDSSTWNRFFWVMQYAVAQGFYVVPEFHFDQAGLQNNATLFASEWRRFWKDFVRLPTYGASLSGRVFPELANEWDKFGCRWDTTSTGCAARYDNAMAAAATAIKDETLAAGQLVPMILINGVGQLGYGFNWGDGYVNDATIISPTGYISDSRPYFTADAATTRGYRIGLAPHVYGPSVTGETVPTKTFGATLWNRLNKSWGSKSACPTCTTAAAGTRQFYPIAPTEWGSDCDIYTNPNCTDANFLRDFALYMNNTGGAAAYPHLRTNVWFWWCWNANSGDTGGVVTSTWYAIKWHKVQYLQTVGLCPWWTPCYGSYTS